MNNLKSVEFKVGDLVTFKPYEKAHKAKVKEVLHGYLFSDDIYYRLTGVSYTDEQGNKRHSSVNSITTGGSIIESKYYDDTHFTWR